MDHSPTEDLRPEELETINWLIQGFTIREISEQKMDRSVESINLYIRAAKKKLKAKTRDQMIAKAVSQNLL